MMKLSDQFDFSYYERHPEWQTEDEWTRIQNLYTFLQVQSGTGNGLSRRKKLRALWS